MPARNEGEAVAGEQRPEDRRVARKLPAELDALVANCGSVADAVLEGNVGAEVLEDVIGPGERADAEPNACRQSAEG